MEPIAFKAQLAQMQSAILVGPDGLQVKMMPVGMDGQLAAKLFDLQQTAFVMTVLHSMGNISFNASFPDTKSAIAINKSTPQFQIRIPKGDLLTGLRLVALFDIVFDVQIGTANSKAEKPKKEKKAPKLKGNFGPYWRSMFLNGFHHSLDIHAALSINNANDVKEALRKAFNVDSLTFVAPEQFEAWAEGKQLHGLVTMSRQVGK